MEQLLKKYSEIENAELEFKSRIKLHEMEDIYNKITSGSFGKFEEAISQTVNIIKDVGKGSNRCTVKYVNGEKKERFCIYKEKIDEIKVNEYKLSLALEEERKDPNLANPKMCRIKNRASFIVESLPDWRIDLTATEEVPGLNVNKVRNIIKSFFQSNKFLENPLSMVSNFELELEFVGSIPKNTNKVMDIFWGIINPKKTDKNEHQKWISKIANKIVDNPKIRKMFERKYGLKQLGKQPITLTKKDYTRTIIPNIENYYLTDKADGERCMVYIGKESAAVTAQQYYPLDITSETISIFDCERVDDKYYVFDLLMHEGKNVSKMVFSKKVELLQNAAKIIGELKPMVRLTRDFPKQIKEMYERKTRIYPIDGLMFTPVDDKVIYKWKPVEHLTVDFLVLKPPSKIIGIHPYVKKPDKHLYFLFVGINHKIFTTLGMRQLPVYHEMTRHLRKSAYFPTHFAPAGYPNAYIYYSDKPDLHNHICEFKYDNEWILSRMRPDKDVDIGITYGNDFKTAETIWQNYFNPLTLKGLMNPEFGYFAERKKGIYEMQTKFNGFVKRTLINNFENEKYVIDLAAGVGQDMFKLANVGVKNALFIDIDKDALVELNERKFKLQKKMSVATLNLDLSNYKEAIKKIQQFTQSATGIMINFAIHYLLNSLDDLKNFITLVDTLLVPGGRLIITCMNGKKVFDKIGDKKRWDLFEDGVMKYSIVKKYKANTFQSFGQKIDVLLPFSDGKYYTENLVNLDILFKYFDLMGFQHEINRPFGKYLNKFKAFSKKELSDIDKEYVDLYQAITFWKPV